MTELRSAESPAPGEAGREPEGSGVPVVPPTRPASSTSATRPISRQDSGDVVVLLLTDKAEHLLGPLPGEARTGLEMAAHVVAPHNYKLYQLVLAELEARQQAKRRARK